MLATIISVIVGTVLGLISGFAGGWMDWGVSRVMDLMLSLPAAPHAARPVARPDGRDHASCTSPPARRPRSCSLVFVWVFGLPFFARIIRGQVLSLREREFIEAAESLGAKKARLWFKEMLPNLWAPILVYTTLILPQNIAAEAALSFLGVGIKAADPDPRQHPD